MKKESGFFDILHITRRFSPCKSPAISNDEFWIHYYVETADLAETGVFNVVKNVIVVFSAENLCNANDGVRRGII